jgi:hypothetical protein
VVHDVRLRIFRWCRGRLRSVAGREAPRRMFASRSISLPRWPGGRPSSRRPPPDGTRRRASYPHSNFSRTFVL